MAIDEPAIRIVSLTVTENGYCLDPATKRLDPDHPLVQADLSRPDEPRSAIGVLVEALRRRRDTDRPAFTPLTCDNIQGNGHVLREAVLAHARLRDGALAEWIARETRFPSTMVDRITPRTTALAATGLPVEAMPRLVEGNAPAGRLRPELAERWGMAVAPLFAGGAGDNAAGAVGLGAIRPGDAFVSLGTSGVLWATTARFQPYARGAVHTFCHALPGLWHQMGVTLSAASSLAWWAGITGRDEANLLAELGPLARPSEALFLPYLSGERTPHNNGALRGMFAGLSSDTDRMAMTQAVLEGVAFSLRDCLDALAAAGARITEADVIGGGSRSAVWVEILSCVLGIPLHRVADSDRSGAFGAARLARLATTGERPEAVCRPPERVGTVEPDPNLRDAYAERLDIYRASCG